MVKEFGLCSIEGYSLSTDYFLETNLVLLIFLPLNPPNVIEELGLLSPC